MQVVDCLGPRDVLCGIPLLLLTLKHDKNNTSDLDTSKEKAFEREGEQDDETITAGR